MQSTVGELAVFGIGHLSQPRGKSGTFTERDFGHLSRPRGKSGTFTGHLDLALFALLRGAAVSRPRISYAAVAAETR